MVGIIFGTLVRFTSPLPHPPSPSPPPPPPSPCRLAGSGRATAHSTRTVTPMTTPKPRYAGVCAYYRDAKTQEIHILVGQRAFKDDPKQDIYFATLIGGGGREKTDPDDWATAHARVAREDVWSILQRSTAGERSVGRARIGEHGQRLVRAGLERDHPQREGSERVHEPIVRRIYAE